MAALKSVNEACEILRDCQDCDQDLADTLANLGFLHAKNKKYVEAVTVLRQALDLQLQVLSDAHPRTIVTRENLNHALSLHEKASDKIELPVSTCVGTVYIAWFLLTNSRVSCLSILSFR